VEKSGIEKMRIAVLAVKFPYPPTGGADLRNYLHIEALETLGTVRVFCLKNPQSKHEYKGKKLPQYEVVSPFQQESLLRRIGRVNRRIKRMTKSLDKRRIRWLMRRNGGKALATFDPDLIVLEEYTWGPFLPRVRGRLIYDAHNVESVLRESMAKGRPATDRVDGYHTLKNVRRIEQDLANRSEQIWVCSETDLRIMQELYGHDKEIRVIPNCIDVDNYVDIFDKRFNKTQAFRADEGLRILYCGVMNYQPNEDAAKYFIHEIMPLIRKHFGNAKFVLCGRNPTGDLVEAAACDNAITVTGEVPDTKPYYESCDVVVVPLRQGSGTRLKVLEALAMGCPVVTTSKGVEGLNVTDGEHLLIADTPIDFARQVERVVEDDVLAKRLMASGREMVQQHYSAAVSRRAVIASICAMGPSENK